MKGGDSEAEVQTSLQRLGQLTASLSLADQSESVRQKTKAHLLDTLGLILLAREHPHVARARSFLHLLDNATFNPRSTAFLGGVAADALALDDFDEATRIHPGAVVVPALLAAGLEGGTGERLLQGVFSGYEVACRLGDLLETSQVHLRGFHPSAIVGSLAAAAAVARFQGLKAAAIADCVGLAASLTAGLFELDPAGEIKGFQVGMAARNGLRAVLAYRAGYQPSAAILDGSQGVLQAFGSRQTPPSGTLDSDTAEKIFSSLPCLQRISFKPYTHFTDLHPLTAILLDLLETHPIAPPEIERIQIRLPVQASKKLNQVFPPLSLKSARRCPRFAVATLICHGPSQKGDPLIAQFQQKAVKDSRTIELAERISWQTDLATDGDPQVMLEVHLRSGELLATEGSSYPGDGRREESRWNLPQVTTRFLQIGSQSLGGTGEANRWVKEIAELEKLEDVSSLAKSVSRQMTGAGK